MSLLYTPSNNPTPDQIPELQLLRSAIIACGAGRNISIPEAVQILNRLARAVARLEDNAINAPPNGKLELEDALAVGKKPHRDISGQEELRRVWHARLHPHTIRHLEENRAVLVDALAAGQQVYGVTTGFGGSAGTRTTQHEALQNSLIHFLNAGVHGDHPTMNHNVPAADLVAQLADTLEAINMTPRAANDTAEPYNTGGIPADPHNHSAAGIMAHLAHRFFQDSPTAPTQGMPATWVRTAITVRLFSLLEAKSAVRPDVVWAMLELLSKNIVPVIPVRGSISASGDLMPLSYVAGAMQGRDDVFVMLGDEDYKVVSAAQALERHQINPVVFQAKEALAIVNGTAFSVSVGTFAYFDAHGLATLSLLTTGMMVEAIKGSSMSFAEEFSQVRPARGQAYARKVIAKSIDASVLTTHNSVDNPAGALHQDRYSVRTSPQWLGPVIEDYILVHLQLSSELKSVTDNPLVFAATESSAAKILSGGNFQATAVTSAMEKVLGGLLLVGRLVFAQCSELTDPTYNNGLPPNLATQDPSHEFTTKGLDIAMAAYMSELSDICVGRVTSHMQGAEMHNQSLNSLALICARKAHDANDILKKMLASFLWMLCQALDLRVLTHRFQREMKLIIEAEVERAFGQNGAELLLNGPVGPVTASIEPPVLSELVSKMQAALLDRWSTNAGLDLAERVPNTVEAGMPVATTFMLSHTTALTLPQLSGLATSLSAKLTTAYEETRTEMIGQHRFLTPYHLGCGSKKLYRFVRDQLAIPMHRGTPADGVSHPRDNIGMQVTMIYRAIGDDGVFRVVDDFVAKEVVKIDE